MVVAKRQGRSEDQSEDFRQNKQHSWLSPICIGQAQVEEKHIKGGAKALSHRLSLSRVLGRSSPRVFGSTCPHASKMDFPAIF